MKITSSKKKRVKLKTSRQYKKYIEERKNLVMDDEWWRKEKQRFIDEDSAAVNELGFSKTEQEAEKDWLKYKKKIEEDNTTYIDIYDILDKACRIFYKKEPNLKKARQLTEAIQAFIKQVESKEGEKRESLERQFKSFLEAEGFEGLNNPVPRKIFLSSMTGWEIAQKITREDNIYPANGNRED